MLDLELRKALIDVASGVLAPDLILAGARMLNVLSREILTVDIAIHGGRIAAVSPAGAGQWKKGRVEDLGGAFVSPGFIDPHVHVESSMLTMAEYSKASVQRGVTMIAADPHEIGNVLGIPGMRLMFEEAKTVPLRMVLRVPARIPAMPEWLETSGASIDVEETRALLEWPEAVCLAGDINPQLLLRKDEDQLRKIGLAAARGMTVSGQSPYLTGASLNAYAAAGPEDSHVASSVEEIVENQRVGLRTIFAIRPHRMHRPHLRELATLIREKGLDTRYLQFCTDDVYAHELLEDGHIDTRVLTAIEEGIDPMTAYQMATVNVAEGLRIHRDYGSITVGRHADLIVIGAMEKVDVKATMIGGEWVYRDGNHLTGERTFHYPDWAKQTMRVKGAVKPGDMAVGLSTNAGFARVRAIAVTAPKSEEEFTLPIVEGRVMPDARQGVSAIVVIDRHKASGRIGKGFVSRFFLERGAIACTVSHDAHNLMVIGASHDDMAIAANRCIANGGGYVVALDGEVLFELPLPVAGLMSEEPLDLVAEETRKLVAIIHDRLGCPPMNRVLLRMNGLSLPNIPNYGFTDFGMISTNDLVVLEPTLSEDNAIEGGCMH